MFLELCILENILIGLQGLIPILPLSANNISKNIFVIKNYNNLNTFNYYISTIIWEKIRIYIFFVKSLKG